MKLYLGTHRPTWLTLDGPPLMVSLNTLPARKSYRAVIDWFVDSGGFTELQLHGRWRTTATQHAERCAEVVERFGRVEWLSPQDWMCEPIVIAGGGPFVGTGKTVREHQERTVQNYLDLIAIEPDLPWVPVLQGYALDEYHECADLYASAGVELEAAHRVGVGSICRRQSMSEAVVIMRTLAARGLQLHGFGFKQAGIAACWPWMASADSMAWSYNARYEGSKYGRTCARPNGRGGQVASCGNCRHYAIDWHERTTRREQPIQQELVMP